MDSKRGECDSCMQGGKFFRHRSAGGKKTQTCQSENFDSSWPSTGSESPFEFTIVWDRLQHLPSPKQTWTRGLGFVAIVFVRTTPPRYRVKTSAWCARMTATLAGVRVTLVNVNHRLTCSWISTSCSPAAGCWRTRPVVCLLFETISLDAYLNRNAWP